MEMFRRFIRNCLLASRRLQATSFAAMWPLLLLLPLLHAADYDPLTVLVLRPVNFPRLERKIEFGILAAVTDFHSKISVLRQSTTFLEASALKECLPNGDTHLAAVDIETGHSTVIDTSAGVPLHGYNFVLIVELNSPVCSEDPKLLASAKPCGVKSGERPLIGLLNICDGPRWSAFNAAKDLFRHEILHSLGFGTILPTKEDQKAPPSEVYDWWDGSKKQPARRHYLDFAKSTLPLLRAHFNCPALKGIEADGEDRIHLNEYVFGNELMTPKLSNSENFFSFLSSTILEQTYAGTTPWYSVNRTAIAAENSRFWYGRGWGCVFATRSCHEYAKFPFCSANDIRNGLQTTYCIKYTTGKIQKFSSKCAFSPLKAGNVDDNGIQASSLNFAAQHLFGYTGSEALYRFCPISRDIINDRIQLPPGASFIECA